MTNPQNANGKPESCQCDDSLLRFPLLALTLGLYNLKDACKICVRTEIDGLVLRKDSMPSFNILTSIFGRSLLAPAAPKLWNGVAAIYAIQAVGSLIVVQLLGLRYADVALPIVFLILGAFVAVFLRWYDPSNSLGQWKWWAPVFFYALFIFFLSNRSYPNATLRFDTKLFHPIEYTTLGIFWSVAWHNFSKQKRPFLIFLCVLTSGTLFAVSDEIHQGFIPGRNARIADVLLDSVSVALGCGLFMLATYSSKWIKDQRLSQSLEREPDEGQSMCETRPSSSE
jgi:VanZ family protein